MVNMTKMPHPLNDRIMTMRIPLTKDRNATLVSAYAPTMANTEENKDTFYSQLKGTLRKKPEKPAMGEMVRAIKGQKDGKAPGGYGIQAEVWKYGGANLSNRLYQWIINIWVNGHVPQAWNNDNIVTWTHPRS